MMKNFKNKNLNNGAMQVSLDTNNDGSGVNNIEDNSENNGIYFIKQHFILK